MKYVRTFVIQAAHFNGREAYYRLRCAQEAEREKDYEAACSHFRALLPDIHGHNFRIVIEAHPNGDALDRDGYAIDDVDLEEAVLQWDNVNLSVHKDFLGRRATTENMAHILAGKLARRFEDVGFIVTVHETRDIYAEATT